MYLEIRKPDSSIETREIKPGIYSIGSDRDNPISLAGGGVAGRHAILSLRAGGCWIEDLNSPSGTLIEGLAVHGRGEVLEGQDIRIGRYTLLLSQERRPPLGVPPPETPAPQPVPKPVPQPAPVVPAPPNLTAVQNNSPRLERIARDERSLQRKQAIKQQIQRELLERMDVKRLSSTQVEDGELHRRVLSTVETIVREVTPRLPAGLEPQSLIKEIYDEATGLGPLEDLLADSDVNEIMVNGPSRIYAERNGRIELTDRVFLDEKSVMAIIERIVSPLGRRIDESQPYVDARLRDGSRVNAIIHPLSLIGPCITIRKFSKIPFTDEDMLRLNTWTVGMRDFLRACVQGRKNIVVSGGTGSGKTTLLNVLSSFLPERDRIITIEDAAELRLKQPHVVALEARPANIEGKGAITIRDLVRNALRMRPDRIVVGECRGGEALDMLQAMNTGHDGSLTTVHANAPRDVVSRLETLVLMSGMDLPVRAIREQIASAVDLIIHESRFSDGSRRVTNITEIVGLEGDRTTMQDIFVFEQTGVTAEGKIAGRFTPTGSVPTFLEEMRSKGVVVDQGLFDPRH